MNFSLANIILTIGAGIASVASPCILPVLPIVVTGTEKDHRLRPLLLVVGLSITFILMGIISSAFGSLIVGKMQFVEKIAGFIFIAFGILTLFNLNLFKGISFFHRFQSQSRGRWAGFFLGLTLGVVWIPCIGPVLSGVLAMVASQGQLGSGVILLSFYSLGFAIPLLLVGYFSHFFLKKVRSLQRHPLLIRYFSSGILILFGLYILSRGII